jgi:hypothetical protein
MIRIKPNQKANLASAVLAQWTGYPMVREVRLAAWSQARA